MDIKTILVGASGGSSSNGAIELACRIALRFGVHVEGFHVKADPLDLVALSEGGIGMAASGDFFERFAADADSFAAKTRTAFESAVARHGVAWTAGPSSAPPPKTTASAAWREEKGNGPALLARRARFFDLVVLGRSDRVVDEPHSDAVEQTLLHSGRPIILAPAEAPPEIGSSIVVGWNGSPEAVRAMTAALPFLATARDALVVTIGEKHVDSAASALEYLGWHGIVAKHRHVLTLAGVGPGEHLLSTARDAGADLLVMGAYGHTPWREYLFGGATHDITRVSLLSLLLSH
jgi:nucleotide-binding universal stress UspA family protein